MTYFQFLGLFLLPPLAVLSVIAFRRRQLDRIALATLATGIFLAIVYTTPWDNLIVLNGVWTYDVAQVHGIVLGVVPLEEYFFFVLQTLVTGLLVLTMLRR